MIGNLEAGGCSLVRGIRKAGIDVKQLLEKAAKYLVQKRQHKIWMRVVGSLACVVVFCTTYALMLPAITLEKTTYCGYVEHQHSSSCYTQKLICGLEETEGHTHTDDCYETVKKLVCEQEESEEHTHTDDCYEEVTTLVCTLEETEGHVHTDDCYGEPELTCNLEEHTHTLDCHSNPEADVETSSDWEATLPEELTGIWAEDLIAVAESQMDYAESTANYAVGEHEELKGYTRYGAWYGDPYGDWDAMFVSFCLNYAGIPVDVMPQEADVQDWIALLSGQVEDSDFDLYTAAEDYVPLPGDLVFLDTDEDGEADHVGMVAQYSEATESDVAQIKTIEGDVEDKVQSVAYLLDDAAIVGYAALPVQPQEESVPQAMAVEDEESNFFTLTYNEHTVTFNIVDAYGNPILGNYSDCNITGEDATLYKFDKKVPTIDGYAYSGAVYGNYSVVSVSTKGYQDGSTDGNNCNFRFYSTDPIQSGQWYTIDNNATVTLTYTLTDLDGKSFVIVNQNGSINYAMTTETAVVNGVDGLKSQTVSMDSNHQVASKNVTQWTFERVDTDSDEAATDSYYISTMVDGVKQYLYLCAASFQVNGQDTNDGRGSLTLSDKPQPITVTMLADGTVTLTYDKSIVNLAAETKDFWCYKNEVISDNSSNFILATIYEAPTVQGVNHAGTVINLFDYWTKTQDASDEEKGVDDQGINADHALKFGKNLNLSEKEKYGLWNVYTGNSNGVRRGIVQNTLGEDGYPALSGNPDVFTPEKPTELTTVGDTMESLAYLFDPTKTSDYKAIHRNVSNLLQVDEQGYYYYNSQKNYAEYNEDSNSFTLYDTWGVYCAGVSPDGQFFPFNSFGEVKDLNSVNAAMNHYFGMTLTTRFVQRYDGYTSSAKTEQTTFEFAGDDDVWIFVDDVLVADLGGNHDAAQVEINFATGKVTVKRTEDSAGNFVEQYNTTLYKAFQDAGKEGSVEWNSNTTFANDTYHTLKFYYLERGNTDSNLSLKYNLASYPPTSINKVNQYGEKVPGAEFAVYAANKEYKYLRNKGDNEVTLPDGYSYDDQGNILDDQNKVVINALYHGVTDSEGQMIFVDDDGMPYTMDELKTKFGEYFILRETKAPSGYRLVNEEIHLHITNDVLLCDNTYDSGVWADANLLISAPNTVKLVNGNTQNVVANGTQNGRVFAVVLKYTGPRDTDNNATEENLKTEANWSPVYGTAEEGFHVVDVKTEYNGDFVKAAIATATKYKESDNIFNLTLNGALEGYLTGLPGTISNYYYMLSDEDKGKTEYTVAYYWTSVNDDELNGATSKNTYRIDADDTTHKFDRTFGATINVPNLINSLFAQKMDEDGELVDGDTRFALYKVTEHEDNQKTIYYLDNNGKEISLEGADYTIDPKTGVITGKTKEGTEFTITPYMKEQTLSADNSNNLAKENGTATFQNMTSGMYYLREISPPEGYAVNDTEVMVYVTENAVYANAGTADDDVTVARGTGYLVTTLDEFASEGNINNTLSWVYEQMRINPVSDTFYAFGSDDTDWKYITENYSTDTVSDRNDALKTYLEYSSDPENTLFNYKVNEDKYGGDIGNVTRRLYTSVGWSYYEIYQDYEYGKGKAEKNGAIYTNLEGQEIANLFSRAVYVQVTDRRMSDLEISKTVVKNTSQEDEFTFTVNLKDADGKALSGAYDYTVYNVGEDGTRSATNSTGTIFNGTGTIKLSDKQVVVIEDLPATTQYTVTEESTPHYSATVVVDGGGKTTTNSVTGTLDWKKEEDKLDTTSTVAFTNSRLPDLTILKYETGDFDNTLPGAQFVLYRTETETNDDGTNLETKYYYYYKDGKSSWETLSDTITEATVTLTSDANGQITLHDIPDGIYTLQETAPPTGYHCMTESMTVTVSDGKFDAVNPVGAATVDNTGLTLQVPNSTGYELPETGGSGTQLYTFGGFLLTAGAILYGYILRRRRERRARE